MLVTRAAVWGRSALHEPSGMGAFGLGNGRSRAGVLAHVPSSI